MFGNRFRLFRLFGFEVRIDASWFIIAVLIAWTLASQFFPEYLKDRSATVYWSLGIITALCLFASIIFHELCHSLVARA